MKLTETQLNKEYILYDAELIENPDPSYFEVEGWRQRGALGGEALGRGTTVFVQEAGQEYVLRHYRRGGMIARLVADRYFWTGLAQTRAWREWRLLAEMWKRTLPVPRPVAARVTREGLFYRADILMCRIPGTQTLADVLMNTVLSTSDWKTLGVLLKRFHEQGVFHADLNARNILRDEQGKFYLIDFDRGRLRKPQRRWQEANCLRLKRSLLKFAEQAAQSQTDFYFDEADWQVFLQAYAGNS